MRGTIELLRELYNASLQERIAARRAGIRQGLPVGEVKLLDGSPMIREVTIPQSAVNRDVVTGAT